MADKQSTKYSNSNFCQKYLRVLEEVVNVTLLTQLSSSFENNQQKLQRRKKPMHSSFVSSSRRLLLGWDTFLCSSTFFRGLLLLSLWKQLKGIFCGSCLRNKELQSPSPSTAQCVYEYKLERTWLNKRTNWFSHFPPWQTLEW